MGEVCQEPSIDQEVMSLPRGGPAYASLSDKRRQFLDHYYQCWNATEAALAAGYGNENYKSAAEVGCRLLNTKEVQTALRELQAESAEQADITLGEIRAQMLAVAGSVATRNSDRLKALEMVTRMKGGFLDKQDINLKGAVKVRWADEDEGPSWLD